MATRKDRMGGTENFRVTPKPPAAPVAPTQDRTPRGPSIIPPGSTYQAPSPWRRNAMGRGYASHVVKPPKGNAPIPDLSGLFNNMNLSGAGADGGAYMASLDASRAGIRGQIANALSEINRQQGVQEQMVGQLPGTFDTLNQNTLKNLSNTANAAQAAQLKSGLRSYTPAGTTMQPMADASTMATGFLKAGVPLLDLGVKDTAQRQRGLLTQAGLDAEAELAREERAFQMQQEQNNIELQYRQREDNLNRLWSVLQGNKDFARQKELARMGYEQDARSSRQALQLDELQRAQAQEDSETENFRKFGIPLTGQEATKLRATPMYNELIQITQSSENVDKDVESYMKEHGYKSDIAGPGLNQFLDRLKALVAYDSTPKVATGGV